MKKIYLTLGLLACFLWLGAQGTTTTLPVELKWRGAERWSVNDSIYTDVVALEQAVYEGALPHYYYEIPADPAYSYQAEVRNAVYVPVESDELKLLAGSSFMENPEVENHISSSRGEKSFSASVCPFVTREGEMLKLKSFDLVLTKTAKSSQETATESGSIHSFASSSVLSKGTFVKVRIKESGVYKLTYSELRSKGIEPSNVRLFGYGGAIQDEDFSKAKHDDLPEVAVYDTGEAILFYAQGINKWTYNNSAKKFTHEINPYSSYGYYFVTSDNVGDKKRIKTRTGVTADMLKDINFFTDYAVYEKELTDVTGVRSGRKLFGETLTNGKSVNVSFNFPDVVSSSSVKVRTAVAGGSGSFSLRLNGTSLGSVSSSSYTDHTGKGADNLQFSLSYSGSGQGYLDYIEVNVQRQLKMTGSYMAIHNQENIGAGNYNRYHLSNAGSSVRIWDINDLTNVWEVPYDRTDTGLSFLGNAETVKSYVAVDMSKVSSIPSATLQDVVPNQNIHGMQSVDMLIITHPSFVGPAESLAQAHNELTGLKVAVVTTEQVYNEFSSGTPDATAYRWASKMFYERPTDKLRYLLLFGKGSFDNRGLLSSSGKNLLLTYQSENSVALDKESYTTDDYFGFLDDTEGARPLGSKDKLDIGIGRFPVVTEAEAWAVVEKTIKYMRNQNAGAWKNQLCFLGDDGDGNTHMTQANTIADAVAKENPDYKINKIMLDAYQQEVNASGQTYPMAKNQFNNLIRSGLLYINYMGHANLNGWTNEQILMTNEVKVMKNQNLPLFSAGTCEFSRYDKEYVSGGEELVLNAQGGGIGCFSATRSVYPGPNSVLMKSFAEHLFSYADMEGMTIGDAVMQAKNATTSDPANKMSFVYFGDPAVRLNYPNQYKVALQEINGKQLDVVPDTLRALAETTIKGYVLDNAGNRAEGFNGTAQVVVLDKEETITTFNNDGETTSSGDAIDLFKFQYRPNTIFKGTVEVDNGAFDLTFMLPKDIKYNYGTGRMVFTVWDESGSEGGQGHCEDFIVGGSSSNTDIDVWNGPTVDMYLNHQGFVSGAKVNTTPVFTAHVADEYGINISGPTPGHDIMLVLDDNQSFVLNDYYESKQGTYKEGTVNYQLPELAEGHYTLMFRVWNLFNVSTIEYMDFEVVKDLAPEIHSVTCYPNPATTETTIRVTHDREDEIIEMTVDVYNQSGQLIWTRTQQETEYITWNFGGQIPSGMYFYRVSVKTGKKIVSSRANKLIIQ